MLTLLKQPLYFQNRKYMLSAFRCAFSRRLPIYLSNLNLGEANDSKKEKRKYGEKKIFLLEEVDMRAPLPGSTNGVPLRESYTYKLKKVPRRSFNKLEVNMPLSGEKFTSIISQYAYNVVDTAMTISNRVECVVHKCPILLRRDFLNLFPSRHLNETLTLVTLCMKTENDMSTWSEEAEEERETLNQYFVTAAKAMTKFLAENYYWADFIDPTTGKPNSSPLVDDVMFETDLRYRNFGLQIEDLGCCKIISHPIWKTNILVGAIFTNAPLHSFEMNCIRRRTLYPIFPKYKITSL